MVCKHKSKKIIIFSLFLILVSGCTKADTNIKEAARESNTITIEAASSEPEEDINPSDTLLPEQEDTNNTEPFNIIASIPEENLHLYYGKEEDVYFDDIYLSFQNKYLALSGNNLSNPAFAPSLTLFEADSNVAVVLIEEEGTGFFITNLHVIKLDDMLEIPYEEAIGYLDRNISSVIRDDGIAVLDLGDKVIEFHVAEIETLSNLFDLIGYGGNIAYYINEDKIYCDIALQVSPACYLGYIQLEYCLEGDSYHVDDMRFCTYSDNQIKYIEKNK